MKKRLDQLLVDKGLVESRSKGQALILAGVVLINDQRIDKPGREVDEDSSIRIKEPETRFVGRGGMKLEHAFKVFPVEAENKICMDVGASTGGFTDCLLQRGAKKVYAVDVGYGQLDWKLRQDPRVIVLERENIRHLAKEKIPEPIELAVADVSFISLKIVLPTIQKFLAGEAQIVALVKPQFELTPEKVGKGGIVKDINLHVEAVESVQAVGEKEGWKYLGSNPSPILGAEGNREFLIYFSKK